jgi:hypothetical protein
MKTLSFDVGIKNLSYCIVDVDKIILWDIISLQDDEDKSKKGKSISEVSPILYNILHNKFFHQDIDYVVIENQPVMKNPTMKSIQMLIYSYFIYLKTIELKPIKSVEFIGAITKVKLSEKVLKENNIEFAKCADKAYAKYKYNKKIAIECTNVLLRDNTDFLDFFKSHKKKDDLADSYLLALVNNERKRII